MPPKPTPDSRQIRESQNAIGEGLRRLFEDVVNEPVPEEFLELLRRADEREQDPESTR